MKKRYYFAIMDSFISITDANYFDENGFQSEWSLTKLNKKLGDYFHEDMEGVYETDLTDDNARKYLLSLGLTENEEFTNFLLDIGNFTDEIYDVVDDNDNI